ncbi:MULTISPECIES: sensor histidine kinase [unclassified Corynebacterium]|uniref:sensor histidine kinase n=1 Tax=unclassified Corynebacterium TaxID=2624378 RepID=UPI0030B65071
MTKLPFRSASPVPSVEVAILRAGALVIALTATLWKLESITKSFPDGLLFEHWYPVSSVLLFFSINFVLVYAAIVGHKALLQLVLRLPLVATLLAACGVFLYDGYQSVESANAVWFLSFAGIAAVSFSLTSSFRASIVVLIVLPGLLAILNSLLMDVTDPIEIFADSGFSVVLSFPFLVFAGAARRVSQLIDATDDVTRRTNADAVHARIRAEELKRFGAYVHDYVLTELSAIANGLKTDFKSDEAIATVFNFNERVEVSRLVTVVERRIGQITPGCKVSFQATESHASLLIPGSVANTMLLAVSEAARNSSRHAGQRARRWCTINIKPGQLAIAYSDDGVGFEVEDINPGSAGVRLSIVGRMDSLDGGRAVVSSEPGRGTSVELEWEGETVEATKPLAEMNADMPMYDLMGMAMVFSPQYWLALNVVLLLVALTSGQLLTPLGFTTYATCVVLLGVLMQGHFDTLPTRRSMLITVGMMMLSVVGLYQDLGPLTEWVTLWHFSMVSLLGALLAMRGRPFMAVIAVLGAALAIELLRLTGLMDHPDINGFALLTRCVMTAAGVLSIVTVRYLLRRLPDAINHYNLAIADASAAEAYEDARRSNYSWLEDQVSPVFDAARILDTPTPALRKRARLTELRLRDHLRSPRLNQPSLQACVWDARSRGVTVTLLDDRSHSPIDQQMESTTQRRAVDSGLARLMPEFMMALDAAETGTVTIRLLPPGRKAFASISDENGVQRFTSEGTKL